MQNPRLAVRYAKSLLDLAVEKGSLEAVLKDMQLLKSICSRSHEFSVMLRSPVVNGDKKIAVISEVLKGNNVSELTDAFIKLLVSKGREENLQEIADAFVSQYNDLKNIKVVKLTTAVQVSDDIKASIKSKIASFMPKDTINLDTATDEKLIGGFVLEVDDKLYDASIRKSLNDFRSKIMDDSYVSKM